MKRKKKKISNFLSKYIYCEICGDAKRSGKTISVGGTHYFICFKCLLSEVSDMIECMEEEEELNA